ncbi:hypothetical protein HK102_008004, partial [Quaeritorhiza haematococci]
MNLRIALLVCDQETDELVDQYGDYDFQIRTWLRSGVHWLGLGGSIQFEVVPFAVQEGDFPDDPEEWVGMIVTGSRFAAYHQHPWILALIDYIQEVYEKTNVKLAGISFGHQVLCRALGGKVVKNPAGLEAGTIEMALTDLGRAILQCNDWVMDHVSTPPPGFEILASTKSTPIQCIYNPSRVFTTQGHPEFSTPFLRDLLTWIDENEIPIDELPEILDTMERTREDHAWLGS